MEPDGDFDDDDRQSPAHPTIGHLPRADSNRTLVDVVADDEGGGKRSWSHFKEKLKQGKIASRGAAWTPTVPVPTSDIPIGGGRSASRHPSFARVGPMVDAQDPPVKAASGRFDEGRMKKLEREDYSDEEEEEEVEEERAPAVKMSLMSLLMDDEDEEYMMDDEDEEEEEDEGGEYNDCCVCMVRHKGSAFEPCGHSFCRLCSREMWAEDRENNCPLCNNYILEILDIF